MNIRSKYDDFNDNVIYSFIDDENKTIMKWYIVSNGDLYWQIVDLNHKGSDVVILNVKKDNPLSEALDNMFYEYRSGQVFINETDINLSCDYLNSYRGVKDDVNSIFNNNNNSILWHSNDDDYINSNYVVIEDNYDKYSITFHNCALEKEIAIRFKTNGAGMYHVAYLPFLRAYNNLPKLIDKDNKSKEDIKANKIYEIKKAS